jgi:hypothetical protein
MVRDSREHEFLRIVLSAREEFLMVWRGRRGELEGNPFYAVHDLFIPPQKTPTVPVVLKTRQPGRCHLSV